MTRFDLLEIDDVPAPAAAPEPTPASAPAPVAPPAEPAPAPPMTFPFAQPSAEALIPTPAGMRTSQGVPMSERMSRCYAWLRVEVAAGFDPFWTDTHVAQYAAKIDAAIAKAEGLPIGGPGLLASLRDDLVADLRAVRSRTPQARVEATLLAADVKPVVKHASEELVAVGAAGETTGAVVYWSLSGDLDLGEMTAAWNEAGLPLDWLPAVPSEAAAFHRAAKDEQSGRSGTLVRHHPDGGWQFVFEVAASGKPLTYDVGPRLMLDEEDKVVVVDDEHKDHPKAPELLERVRLAFETHKRTVASNDVSTWLIWLCRAIKAVSLRQTGGVYFIPRDSVDEWHKAKGALRAASGHRIFEIPALKSADAIAAILEAVQAEVNDLAEQLQGELAEGVAPRKARNRIEQVDAILVKIEGYERLLGAPMKGARDTLAALHTKLRQSTTRGAMLEID